MYTFEFDVPTGVYYCEQFRRDLLKRAQQPGPVLDVFGAAVCRTRLDELTIDDDASRVLIYQARWIAKKFYPVIDPELRILVPVNFGRSRLMTWYHRNFEMSILSLMCAIPEVDPKEVL